MIHNGYNFGNVQTAFNTLNELHSRTPDFNWPKETLFLTIFCKYITFILNLSLKH